MEKKQGYSRESIDAIREKIDLIEFAVDNGIPLRRISPDKWVTACIFHSETKPSLYVYKSTQTYCCYGCNRTGDLFSLYQHLHECNFARAVEALAEEVGIELEEEENRLNWDNSKLRTKLDLDNYITFVAIKLRSILKSIIDEFGENSDEFMSALSEVESVFRDFDSLENDFLKERSASKLEEILIKYL